MIEIVSLLARVLRLLRVFSLATLFFAPLFGHLARADGPLCVASTEKHVRASFPGIRHGEPDEVARLLSDGGEHVVLLDAREEGEWEVSHLAGSIRVPLKADGATLARLIGPAVAGRTVVIYCSVGVRSSQLAQRTGAALAAAGARAVINMSGGIFRWHNEGRPIVNASGPTSHVHPYDRYWGRHLADRSMARYVRGASDPPVTLR